MLTLQLYIYVLQYPCHPTTQLTSRTTVSPASLYVPRTLPLGPCLSSVLAAQHLLAVGVAWPSRRCKSIVRHGQGQGVIGVV